MDGGRPGDIYVCHGMPGNVFATIWDTDPRFTPALPPAVVERALSSPGVAGADLILCGHAPGPLVQRTGLPNGRTALVVRGWQGRDRMGFVLLTHRGPATGGFAGWEITIAAVPFEPRDPTWTWNQPSRRPH